MWIPPANQPVSTSICFSAGNVPGVRHLIMCGAVSPLSVCHHGSVSWGTDISVHYYQDFCDSSYSVSSLAFWIERINKIFISMKIQHNGQCVDVCTWECHYSEKNQQHHQFHVTHWEILHIMSILLIFILHSAGLTSHDFVPWISVLTAIVVLLLKLFVAGVP
jgi:uncharacterized integral membrane protein